MSSGRASAQRDRAHKKYSPPDPRQIQETTLGQLLQGLRRLPGRQGDLFDSQEAPNSDRVVWCAGHTELLSKTCVAIVGTRSVSGEGAMRARRLARELVESGLVVVSGLAKGVDTEALTAAIAAGGSVVAVIGTPLDRAYPAENARLQEQIAADHLLISQFPAGARTFPSSFPVRNRLMAAVSDATVIIEAGDTSGTLHQAAECVRLGRWLFIARSVMDDASLEWPSKFREYPNVRTLERTAELLEVLRGQA